MKVVEHIPPVILSIAALLEIIAIGNGSVDLYYTGSGIAMTSSLVWGLAWLIRYPARDIFRIIFVGSVSTYLLWILLILKSHVAMLVLSWLTFIVVCGSLWLVQVNTSWGFRGIILAFFVLQLGYTFLGAGTSVGGTIAALVIGWLGLLGSFYYDKWLQASEERHKMLPDFKDKIVVVEDGTPAVAVGHIDYGATSRS